MPDFTRLFSCALLLLTLVITQSYGAAQVCTSPPPNMVAWWPGDGSTKNIAGPNNGKLVNGATFATGFVGKAFALNGAGQFVDVKKAKPLNVSAGDFTVDAWVYFTAIAGLDQSIVDKMSDNLGLNSDGWRLIEQRFGDLFWFCLGGGAGNNGCIQGSSTTVTSTTNAVAGNWYFVTAVKTSTQISIFINGNLENTTSLGPFTDTNSTDLLIGAKQDTQDNGGAYLNGLVDEVELFNRALSPAEILAIYDAGNTGKCKVLVGLTPGKLTFASQSVGTTSPPQPVTLKNKSPNGGVLNITSISTTGDFGQTNQCPSLLNPGQKCVIQVTFTPTAQGTRTGKLSVTDNSPNSLPQQVSLMGTGR